MRRAVSGLLTFVALLALVPMLSCFQLQLGENDNPLRIMSVNGDGIVMADIGDYGIFRDPTDPEGEPEWVSGCNDVIVPVVMQYVEIGSGYQTWTPYVAKITKARIKYTYVSGENVELPDVNLPVNFSIKSDPSGQKTFTGNVNVMPAIWLIEHFGGPGGSPPEDITELSVYRATLTLEGVDESSGKALRAVADIQINVGDYWDDPSRLGQ